MGLDLNASYAVRCASWQAPTIALIEVEPVAVVVAVAAGAIVVAAVAVAAAVCSGTARFVSKTFRDCQDWGIKSLVGTTGRRTPASRSPEKEAEEDWSLGLRVSRQASR